MSSRMHSWFDRSSEQPLAPAMLVGLIVTLTGAVIAMKQVSPWFSPGLLLLSIGGVVFVALRQTGAGLHSPSKAREENFSKLGAIDFSQTEQWLKANVRRQDEAIEIVISSLRSQVAIAQRGQLLGSFLLVGPTGTGKTFLPQLLAQALYPDSEPVLLRMNQYKTNNDVQTLLGPPPGMAGYEVGGSLTRPVLVNPKRVVILDELEKAHPDLHHCLFDILDSATCREKSSGKEVDFSQCVFFGTSNAGVDTLRKLRQQINPTKDQALWVGQSRDPLVDKGGFDTG